VAESVLSTNGRSDSSDIGGLETVGSGVNVGSALGVAVGVSEIVTVDVCEFCETGSSIVGSDDSSSANVGAIVEITAAKRVKASARDITFTERFSECQ
jgi:hypothetical protein